MEAFVHYSGGAPFNEDCAAAEKGFSRLGISCVAFSSNEGLDASSREDIVVAGMLVTGHALARRGVTPPSIDYPKPLLSLLGRRVWTCEASSICEGDLPVFVKPLLEKDLPATVVQTLDDLSPYLNRERSYELLCSDPIEIDSEWRVFVRYGKALGISRYRGKSNTLPDTKLIERAIESYEQEAPHGYAADFGVTTDGQTVLIEVNDGYSLGCYELDPIAYALLLSARWAELVGAEDPLRHVDFKPGCGARKRNDNPIESERLSSLLAECEGATEAFLSTSAMIAVENGVVAGFCSFLEKGGRTTTEVWGWLQSELSLKLHAIKDAEYIFPRVGFSRFIVDKSCADPLGCSFLKRYDLLNVASFFHVDDEGGALRRVMHPLIMSYAEEDARNLGYAKIFSLLDDDDEDELLLLSRGYVRGKRKDDDRLADVLGAYVGYDYILEKDLSEHSG